MNFRYDDTTHSYTVDGIEYPGVTSLLKPLSDYDKVPEFMLERKRVLGRAVHAECSQHLLTDGGVNSVRDMAIQGYMEAFFLFEDEHRALLAGRSNLVIERPMVHKKLRYAGTPDLIINGVAIIDIKTRGFNKIIDPMQLAAYEYLWTSNGGKLGQYQWLILELCLDGKYKLKPANNRQAWSKFRFLLDHHWHCIEYQQNIEKWRKVA